MPWNPNTKIMTAPIGIGDISQAVGYASGYLDALILNGVINKWAKFKPERHSAIGEMTLLQRQQNGWGFDITVGAHTSVFQKSARTALDVAMAQRGEWMYLRPRGIENYNEWFRKFDFLNPSDHAGMGYNANAPQPYTYQLPSGDIGSSSSSYTGSIPVTRPVYNGQCDILDFNIQGGGGPASIGDLYLGVLTQKNNDPNVTLVRSDTKLSQLAYGGTVNLAYTLPSPGMYFGCIVATDAIQGGDGTGNFMWLPKSVFNCSLSIQSIPVEYTLELVGSITMAMTYDAATDKYKVSLDMIVAYFNDPQGGAPRTSGQPFEMMFSFLTMANENFWNYTYDQGHTLYIPNNTSAVVIDLAGTPEYIYIDGEDLRKVASAGDTIKLYIQLGTTGPNGNDVYASLNYGGSGMAFTVTMTVPPRT